MLKTLQRPPILLKTKAKFSHSLKSPHGIKIPTYYLSGLIPCYSFLQSLRPSAELPGCSWKMLQRFLLQDIFTCHSSCLKCFLPLFARITHLLQVFAKMETSQRPFLNSLFKISHFTTPELLYPPFWFICSIIFILFDIEYAFTLWFITCLSPPEHKLQEVSNCACLFTTEPPMLQTALKIW